MGNVFTALFLALGAGALAYSQLGKRVGYGNAKNVWTLVGMAIAITFVVAMLVLTTFISLD